MELTFYRTKPQDYWEYLRFATTLMLINGRI